MFLAEVVRKSALLRQKLDGLVARYPDVFDAVRGSGLMIGVVCKAPVGDIVSAGYDALLLTVPAGENTLRLLPPLNITDDEIAQAVARLEAAASAVRATLSA
ncbi:MAG: acetylornithine/N-succinyldiaminopimelate aminotransferase [Paracoccaceae bacterium]